MARAKSIYRRLTGRYRTLLGYSQLWIATDHLLLVKSSRLAEEYRRFAFSDIQAVVITELPDSQVTQFVGVLVALLWTALAATVTSNFSRGFFLVSGVWLMVLAVTNLVRGRRCRCHLHTAVSRELLTPIRRVRTARDFLARIRPEIEAVQGSLPAGDTISAQVGDVGERPPEVPRPALGYAMEILFGLILVDAIIVPVAQRFPALGQTTSSLMITTFFTEIVLAIFVLVRRASHDPRRAGFMLAIVALVCLAVDIFGIGSMMVTWFQRVMESAQRHENAPPPFVWNLSPIWMYFMVGWRIFVGLAGLLTARMERASDTLEGKAAG